MRNILATLLMMLAGACGSSEGEAVDRAAIESEVRAAIEAERADFESRDCERAMRSWNDDRAVAVVNARQTASAKAEIRALCDRVMERLPPNARPREIVREDVYVVSEDTAYTITFYAKAFPAEGAPPSAVTKIWSKVGGEWRVQHLHESFGAPLESRSDG